MLACMAIVVVLSVMALAFLARQLCRALVEQWRMNEEPGMAFRFIGTLLDWGWLLVLALWGGTAAYIERMRKNDLAFSVVTLVGDWVVSGFVGILTAYVCMEAGLSFYVTAAACGVAGHQGGRAIAIVMNWAKARQMP